MGGMTISRQKWRRRGGSTRFVAEWHHELLKRVQRVDNFLLTDYPSVLGRKLKRWDRTERDALDGVGEGSKLLDGLVVVLAC
jgi:hypothetical protein